MQDLAALVLQLHLFGGVAVFAYAADARDEVEEDLVRERLCRERFALRVSFCLRFKLRKPFGTRAGYRLIGGGDERFNGRDPRDGRKRHQRDDGGAVGVGDDAVVLERIAGVDLRHDERHIRVKAEGAGIVHKHRARSFDGGGKALCDVVFRRAEHDVHAFKRRVAGFLDDDFPPCKGNGLARAARACKQAQLCNGEVALGKHFDHLLPDGARCAEDGYVIKLFLFHRGRSFLVKLL